MKKKSLIILVSMLTILFVLCGTSFANENFKNDLQAVGNDISDGASSLVNGVRNGVGAIENTAESGLNSIGTGITSTMDNMGNMLSMDNMNTNGGYTAQRTSVTGVTNDYTNATIWTWITVAIAAAVIVGLVWYYAVEHNIER